MDLKRFVPGLGWVIGLALIVRLVVLSRFGHSAYFSPTSGDMKFYADWGQRIAAGQWTDFRAFYGLPGYPFFLGGVFKYCGFSPYTLAALQMLSETAIAALIFQIATWAFPGGRGRVAGVLAALGWIFFQPAQALSLLAMPTTWAVLAFWGVFAWSVRTGSRSLWRPWVLLGVLIGLAATFVATVLAVLPIPIAAAARNLRRPRAVLVAAACLLAGVAAGTSPCWYHNYFIAHEPVFLSAHSGLNFWVGNNPVANGYPKLPPGLRPTQACMLNDSIRMAETAAGHPLKHAEVSRYWSDKANAYIREHPGQWLKLMALKLRNFWSAQQYDDLSVIQPMAEEGVLTHGLRFGWVAVFALVGIAATWGRSSRSRWIVAGVALGMAALLPVFVTERYRLIAVPGLLLLGAGGLVEFWGALRCRSWNRIALWMGAGVAAFLVVHLPPAEPELKWLDDYNSGRNALQCGSIGVARVKLERARALAPRNADILAALGTCSLRDNDYREAKNCYAQALQIDPNTLTALNNLALLEMGDGHWAEAQALLIAGLRIEPNDPGMRELAGRCASKLEQPTQPQ